MSLRKTVLCLSTAILVVSTSFATPPPGYVKKSDNDKDPPRYEYGYDVRDGKGSRQGHLESRDGVHALGLYYVKLPGGSGTSVRYLADDWGYHPLVSYSSSTKTSSTKAHFALGEKAVAALSKEPQPTIDSLSAAGPTAAAVANSLDKLASSAGKAVIATGTDILRVHRPGDRSFTGSREEETSQLRAGQTDVSAVNNLIDNNSDNDRKRISYKIVPAHSTPSTTISYVQTGEQSETSDDDSSRFKGIDAASYQIVDIGGAGNFYSQSPSHRILTSESTSGSLQSVNHGSSSTEFGEDSSNINLEVFTSQGRSNGNRNFGDRIRQKTTSASSSTAAPPSFVQGEQDISSENYKHKEFGEEQSVVYVTSTPGPQLLQSHSIRPIVVVDDYSRETEHKESVTQSQAAVEDSTKAPIYVSHLPEPSSNSLSGASTSGGASSVSSTTSSPSSSVFAISNGHSGNIYHLPQPSILVPHEEGKDVSVTSEGHSGSSAVQHTTPATLFLSSHSHDSNHRYESEKQTSETHSNEDEHFARPEVAVNEGSTYTTPQSPVLVTYLKAISGPGGTHYSSTNDSAQNLIYSTSTPNFSNLHGYSDSSTAGGRGVSVVAHYSTPLSIFISHSRKASSEHDPSAIITSINGQTGHVVPRGESSYSPPITTTTPRPNDGSFASLSHDERGGSSKTSDYLLHSTPSTIIIDSTAQPIAASLTSSAEILAPLQAGVSLINSDNEGVNAHKSITAFSTITHQEQSPPQVKEEIDDLPLTKTVVEIQKAIPLNFDALKEEAHRLGAETEKINEAQFLLQGSHIHQDSGIAKPHTEESIFQTQFLENQQAQTGNALHYAYSQPFLLNYPFGYVQDVQQIYTYPPSNPHIFVLQQVENAEQHQKLEPIRDSQQFFEQNSHVLDEHNKLHHQSAIEKPKIIEVYKDQVQGLESESERTGLQSNSNVQPSVENAFGQRIIHSPRTEYAQHQHIDTIENSKSYFENGLQGALVHSSGKQVPPTFSKRPEELERQLQSEYSQQLIEEQKQEKIKLEGLSKSRQEEQKRLQSHPKFPSEEAHINVHLLENPVPLPVTKLVPVDRPVPFPQPVAVPVPFAVPHPVEVPVPHIVPYPHLVTVPLKELHSVYFQGKQHQKVVDEPSYHYHVQHFPSRTPIPTILKALQYGGGRYGVPVSMKHSTPVRQGNNHHQHHHQSQNTAESIRVSHTLQLSPPPLPSAQKSLERGRPSQKARHQEFLKNLCIEYGFKPPLVPSIQIDDDTPLSFGPPQKD